MLNMGIKMINIGVDMPDFGMQMPNLYFQIQNIDMQIQNLGAKINMKNNMMPNMNMNIQSPNIGFQNQNMMMNNAMFGNMNIMKNNLNEEWNLRFEESNGKITNVKISPSKRLEEAIKLFIIKSNYISSQDLKFMFNGQLLNRYQVISKTELENNSKIIVIDEEEIEYVG